MAAQVQLDDAATGTAPPGPRAIATAVAFPPHRYRQKELAAIAARVLPSFQRREGFLERLFQRVGVEERCLALAAEQYASLTGLESRCRAWLEVALDLSLRCVRSMLHEVDARPSDVGLLTFTTVTGLAVPSLDARLMNLMPFDRRLKRVPLFGLGCVGGAAGLARASEYLRAYPDQLAVVLAVELCSLTLQREDASLASIIASGLFGDGAGAVLLAGTEHPLARNSGLVGPALVESESTFFPNSERVMGWDIVDAGFKVVLSPTVPEIVRAEVPPAVDAFLARHGLAREDIDTWISHPGGPKVLAALEEGLGLAPDALAASREALSTVGNLSSVSVLYLLDRHRRGPGPEPGTHGVLVAMGPGFCAELVLLRW